MTTRNDIRDCVLAFSKAAPQDACPSSNRLLRCSLPPLAEKCGPEAVDFVREYITRQSFYYRSHRLYAIKCF